MGRRGDLWPPADHCAPNSFQASLSSSGSNSLLSISSAQVPSMRASRSVSVCGHESERLSQRCLLQEAGSATHPSCVRQGTTMARPRTFPRCRSR